MRVLDLFAGIGGFSIAAEWMDWETVAFVERDEDAQRCLKTNFPGVPIIRDIFKTDYATIKSILRTRGIRNRRIDLITGGFPCQPFFQAGKQLGEADERFLFPEMLRVINVRGLISIDDGRTFESIAASLENIGYSVGTFIVPASAVGAPHRRDRVWIVAYADRAENHAKR